MEKVVKVWMQSSTSNVPVCTTLSVFLFFYTCTKWKCCNLGQARISKEKSATLFINYTDSNWSYLLSIKAVSENHVKMTRFKLEQVAIRKPLLTSCPLCHAKPACVVLHLFWPLKHRKSECVCGISCRLLHIDWHISAKTHFKTWYFMWCLN